MSTQRRGWEWNSQKNAKLWEMYVSLIPNLTRRVDALEEKFEGPKPETMVSLAMKVMFAAP